MRMPTTIAFVITLVLAFLAHTPRTFSAPGGATTFAVEPLPDLGARIFGPSAVRQGDAIDTLFEIYIDNDGDAAAFGFGVDVELRGDPDLPRPTISLGVTRRFFLNAGEFKRFFTRGTRIPFDATPGVAYLCARVDGPNRIREYNEQNNVTCNRISIYRGRGPMTRDKR